jgi:hypothetical protein
MIECLKSKSGKTKFSDYEILEYPNMRKGEYAVPIGMIKTDIGNLYLFRFIIFGGVNNFFHQSYVQVIYERMPMSRTKIFYSNRELENSFGYYNEFFSSVYWSNWKKSKDDPILIKPRKCSNWIEREIVRVVYGEYNLLDSNILVYPIKHFPHIVVKDKELFVSFIPDDKYGDADRRVQMKIGRYLTKYTAYSNEEIKTLILKLKIHHLAENSFSLHFTEDRDKIREIFEIPMYAQDSSQVSCMYNKFQAWEFRPYDIYAHNPTMCVAYMTCEELIVARSVINVAENGYVRTYAIKENNSLLHTKFRKLLQSEGYHKTSLEGCWFYANYTKSGHLIAPYIDGDAQKGIALGTNRVSIVSSDEWSCWDYEFTSTDGVAEPGSEDK